MSDEEATRTPTAKSLDGPDPGSPSLEADTHPKMPTVWLLCLCVSRLLQVLATGKMLSSFMYSQTETAVKAQACCLTQSLSMETMAQPYLVILVFSLLALPLLFLVVLVGQLAQLSLPLLLDLLGDGGLGHLPLPVERLEQLVLLLAQPLLQLLLGQEQLLSLPGLVVGQRGECSDNNDDDDAGNDDCAMNIKHNNEKTKTGKNKNDDDEEEEANADVATDDDKRQW